MVWGEVITEVVLHNPVKGNHLYILLTETSVVSSSNLHQLGLQMSPEGMFGIIGKFPFKLMNCSTFYEDFTLFELVKINPNEI